MQYLVCFMMNDAGMERLTISYLYIKMLAGLLGFANRVSKYNVVAYSTLRRYWK